MKRTIFFFASIQLVLLSCATVTFNVDHPPQVDLRGVNSITIIPFEWDSSREDAYLAGRVTAALLSGIRRGSINLVDPYSMEYSRTQNYSKYADVFILGRILDIRAFDNVHRRDDTSWSYPRIIITTTRTVYVDIEYTYYRSNNNVILRSFKKSESSFSVSEQIRRASERRDRQASTPAPGHGASTPRRNGREIGRGYQRGGMRVRLWRDEWTNSIAANAILGFAETMNSELGPWTTRERRIVRGKSSGDRDAKDAKKFARQGQYNLALEKFNSVYQRTADPAAGYNAAILFAANNRFEEALALLQKIDKAVEEAGKKSPSYLKTEKAKIIEYIDGFKILESAKASAPSVAPGVSVPKEIPVLQGNGVIIYDLR